MFFLCYNYICDEYEKNRINNHGNTISDDDVSLEEKTYIQTIKGVVKNGKYKGKAAIKNAFAE